MDWKTDLEVKLKIIEAKILNRYHSEEMKVNTSLFDSDFSIILFALDKYLETNESYFYEILKNLSDLTFQYFLDSEKKEYSLCNGIMGLLYVEYNLVKNKKKSLFDPETKEFFETRVLDWSIIQAKYNNWDYLHGSLGVISIFLDFNPSLLKKDEYLSRFLETMVLNRKSNEGFIYFDSAIYPKSINLGVPHGIPGILLVLLRLYKVQKVSVVNSIINDCISCLRQLYRMNNAKDYTFSPIYHFNGENIKSRVAWCYGDLIYIYLNDFLRKFNRELFSQEEIRMIKEKVYARTLPQDTLSLDNCLCHGNSGNALIEYYSPTIDSRFWLNTFVSNLNNEFYFFDRFKKEWLPNYSFLNGLVGVHQSIRQLLKKNTINTNQLLLLYE